MKFKDVVKWHHLQTKLFCFDWSFTLCSRLFHSYDGLPALVWEETRKCPGVTHFPKVAGKPLYIKLETKPAVAGYELTTSLVQGYSYHCAMHANHSSCFMF